MGQSVAFATQPGVAFIGCLVANGVAAAEDVGYGFARDFRLGE